MTFTDAELDALTRALTYYRQLDAEGVMVAVSRQACDEAAAAITYLRKDRDNAVAEAHDAGAERAIWKEIAERCYALASLEAAK